VGQGCCRIKRLRKIRVADFEAGVTGLDEILEHVYRNGWVPDQEGLGKVLLDALRAAGNYVTPKYEAAYSETLVGLYRGYYEAARRQESPTFAK